MYLSSYSDTSEHAWKKIKKTLPSPLLRSLQKNLPFTILSLGHVSNRNREFMNGFLHLQGGFDNA